MEWDVDDRSFVCKIFRTKIFGQNPINCSIANSGNKYLYNFIFCIEDSMIDFVKSEPINAVEILWLDPYEK